MKILLPVDGSDCSTEALNWVSTTFDKANTHYFLISVTPIVMDIPITGEEISATSEILQHAKKYMEGQGCHIDTLDQLVGFPGSEICQYAEKKNLDAVVMGCNGHSGFRKFLLGSISENVLEHCKKAVIIYRQSRQP